MTKSDTKAGPPVYIYKTRNDYYDKVPVTLSESGNEIVSFPDIKDVYSGGEPAYPTRLDQGYLLDNRGIGKNSAFLKITFEEYHNLPETPKSDELYNMILDKDPFVELYYCGSRFDYKDLVPELNKMIVDGNLQKCERIR